MLGDAKELPLDDESVEAIVTDPPYGLSFMGEEWDHAVPGVPFWEEALRVLKPGGHLLAFGGTRIYHRLTAAIEDAGFEIRDCLSWMYGTGFPKSHDLGRAVDEELGADPDNPERWRQEEHFTGRGGKSLGAETMFGQANLDEDHPSEGKRHVYVPKSEKGEAWDGFGTALKPGWEPIVLAMKPTEGTFAENALAHGVAGLNVDGCRIRVRGERPNLERTDPEPAVTAYNDGLSGSKAAGSTDEGRWPANAVLSHTRWCRPAGTARVESGGRKDRPEDTSGEGPTYGGELNEKQSPGYADEDGREEVEVWDCPPCCPVRQLDEHTGELGTGHAGARKAGDGMFELPEHGDWGSYEDAGGASRFFYCAKASRSEREAGLENFEKERPVFGDDGGTYQGLSNSESDRANLHPTVKPIDLCRWLVRLVTRPGHTVLDPFMGSGSTGCAAVQERRNFVGVDNEPEYVPVARARIRHWDPDQLDMFKDGPDTGG